jgi:hypothetical protein
MLSQLTRRAKNLWARLASAANQHFRRLTEPARPNLVPSTQRLCIGAREAEASHATRERLMAAAREQLGDVAFAAAWAKGQTMTLERAVEKALDDQLESRADPLGPPG